jgi:alkylhydroperoxidase family enzyme
MARENMSCAFCHKPHTAAERVRVMIDDLLLLVAAYNASGRYDVAMEAQAVVVALNKFDADHDMDDAAWPPQPDPEGGDFGGGLLSMSEEAAKL